MNSVKTENRRVALDTVIDWPRLYRGPSETEDARATLRSQARDDGRVIVSGLTYHLKRGWNEYVRTSPDATFFHELDWMEAVQEVYGHTPHYLVAYASETCRVQGILPLFEVQGPLTKRALISVPYAVYGGVAADNSAVQTELLNAAKKLARELNVSYVEIRQGTPLEGFSDRCQYFTFRKRMPESSEDVLMSFPSKARNKLRQAINTHQLTTAIGPHLLDEFYELYVLSLRRLASPPHQRLFFQRLIDRFGQRCQVHLVYHGTTPIAGALALVHNACVAPYFVGLNEAFHRMHMCNFLYYSLMRHAIDSGLTVFDLGRTRQDNIGGCEFKMNQGFQPESLHYNYYSPLGLSAPDLRHSNPKFALAKAVWRKLPLRCVSLVGGHVTRWIP